MDVLVVLKLGLNFTADAANVEVFNGKCKINLDAASSAHSVTVLPMPASNAPRVRPTGFLLIEV